MYYVDLSDGSGNKLGSGPLTSVARWSVTARQDKAGSFSFRCSATDPQARYIAAKAVAAISAYLNGAWVYMGGGIIDNIGIAIDADGSIWLDVAGDDMLRELTYRSVHELQLVSGSSPVTHAAAVAAVAALAPSGWTFVADTVPGNDSVYGQFAGESVLAAALRVADRSRTHCYLSGNRTLTFVSTWSDSGVRAIQAGPGDLVAETCAIIGLEIDQSSYDLITRIYPRGSGQSKVALTLRATTRTAPAGWTLDAANNYLSNDAAEAAYGRIERWVAFKDITAISNTAADVQSAANMLYDAAYYYLAEAMTPATSYRLTVGECSALLHPMQTIRVVHRDVDAGLDINDALYILECTWAGDDTGMRTTSLVVADTDAWPASDAQAVIASIKEGTVYEAHPQLNANAYVLPYTKPMDDSNDAYFRFRFDDEVTQLIRLTFDFQVLPLESTVKAVGSSSPTTSSGGGTTATSTSGGSSTPTTSSGGSTSVSSASGGGTTATSTSGGSSTPTTSSGGGTSATSSAGGGVSATSSSGGGASVTSASGGGTTVTSDSGSGHHHEINLANSTTGTAVYYAGVGGSGDFRTDGGGKVNTSSTGSGHTHGVTISSHTHGVTISNHVHSVTIDNHVHSVTIGDHSHTVTISGHTHDVTILGHTHTVTIGDHSHTVTIAGHTHDVTIGNHTHTVTPVITTTYGIYRESAGNTFALADLEYSVDASTWYAFAVGVNGYTTLGDGWSRIDLTALLQDATTLRPASANNLLQIRRKSTGAIKSATIDAQLNVRTIIQALALT